MGSDHVQPPRDLFASDEDRGRRVDDAAVVEMMEQGQGWVCLRPRLVLVSTKRSSPAALSRASLHWFWSVFSLIYLSPN
jgi:hypothetical protein